MLETLQQHISHNEWHFFADGIYFCISLCVGYWMWLRKRYYKKKYEELKGALGNVKQENK